MIAIVNADNNWAIGKDGHLLFPIPEDMKFFRQTTLHKVVVMGRKTLLSFPGGRPLKDRVNILLSRQPGGAPEGVTVCSGLPQLADALAPYPAKDVYVIGGESVYRLLLPYCTGALVTRVQAAAPQADTFFPNLDETPGWRLAQQGPLQKHEGVHFSICTYQNTAALPLAAAQRP